MDKEEKGLLDFNFLHSEKFKQKDSGQLKRIEQKLMLLYELKHGILDKTINDIELNFRGDVKTFYKENKKSFLQSLDNRNINMELKNNIIVGMISLSSYLYFTKISKMFNSVHSIALFRPIFLFTFCGAPILISFYFSYLNLNLNENSQRKSMSF
jgi:hypothetical protein